MDPSSNLPDAKASTSSSHRVQSESSDASLARGLAALKQKNYGAAIAQLEKVGQITAHPSEQLKAKMGLVIAYEKCGQAQAAIALCQNLRQSHNRQVQAWAQRTLADLAQRHPTDVTGSADVTGFVPLASPSNGMAAPPPDLTPELKIQGLSMDTPSQTESTTQPTTQPASSEAEPAAALSAQVPVQAPMPAPLSDVEVPSNAAEAATGMPAMAGDTLPAQQPIWQPAGRAKTWKPLGQIKWNPSGAVQLGAVIALFWIVRVVLKFTLTTTNRILAAIDWPIDLPTIRLFERDPHGLLVLVLAVWIALSAPVYRLWFVQVLTAIALFWVVRVPVQSFMDVTNWTLVKIDWPINLQPIQAFYREPIGFVVIVLVLLLVLSPWLLDVVLRLFYGLEPLSVEELSISSPESIRLIRRICNQRGWSHPQLRCLPTSAPVAFTYGCLPRTARIVVSQGLLHQLEDDEIAVICAAELGHLVTWDFALMSGLVLLAQVPY
ncbi:MAG: M48 family metalloprotease [Cyanothece sp. SIO1E1]|nr:M48 family metalloprotease [Cyanothece sp. SIO1E1]